MPCASPGGDVDEDGVGVVCWCEAIQAFAMPYLAEEIDFLAQCLADQLDEPGHPAPDLSVDAFVGPPASLDRHGAACRIPVTGCGWRKFCGFSTL
jgi:hypothetical protein